MELRVDRASALPLGAQLETGVQRAIERGELRPGDRLPSLRELAAAAGVNINTVRALYARLEASGVVRTEQGRGTFVAADLRGTQRELSGSEHRRELREQIARLEAELVRLPAPPPDRQPERQSASAGLLSTEELAAVRDGLLARLQELDAARAEVIQRLQRLEAPPVPARSSSPTLRGVRVRYAASGSS